MILKKLKVILSEILIIAFFELFLIGLIVMSFQIQNINGDINTLRELWFDHELYSVDIGESPIFANESVEHNRIAIAYKNEVEDLELYMKKAELGLLFCEISIVVLSISLLPIDINKMKDKFKNPQKKWNSNSNNKIKFNYILFISGSILWISGFLLTQPFPTIDFIPYL